jgi:hypothetical protein
MSSIIPQVRCEAEVSKRWAKRKRQCKHMAKYGRFCPQHEAKERDFRIEKSGQRPGVGLYTTIDRPANQYITEYDGELFKSNTELHNPRLLHVGNNQYIDAWNPNAVHEGQFIKPSKYSKNNNAEFYFKKDKVYVYSTKDIPRKTEIMAPLKVVNGAPKVQESHEQPEPPKPQPKPKPKPKPRAKSRFARLSKFANDLIKQISVMQVLARNSKNKELLKPKLKEPKFLEIPERKEGQFAYEYDDLINKVWKTNIDKLLKYFQSSTTAKKPIDRKRLIAMIEQTAAKHKNNNNPKH